MDSTLKIAIETQIKNKSGFDFEAFVKILHLEKHGVDGFIPTREVKDKGSDGVIKNPPRIIASFGPKIYKKKEFENKADDDFSLYLNHWVEDYPNWTMYFNSTISPDQIQKIGELKIKAIEDGKNVNDISIHGIDHIMFIIEKELKNKQIRSIATYLNISKELIIKDYIKEVVTDLINGLGIQDENVGYSLKVDIKRKMEINYSVEDIETAKSEYELLMLNGTLNNISSILSIYEVEEINAFKLRVMRDFENVNGDFKAKLNILVENYLNTYSNKRDDDYAYYFKAVLIYCFEQCIIGKKTAEEIV